MINEDWHIAYSGDGETSFACMANEFKPGDKVKWLDPDNDSEMIFGEVSNRIAKPGYTSVTYVSDMAWMTFVKTAELHHAVEDWPRYLVTDDSIVVPPEKKGYEPDGFDREAFDDFMRNL